LNVNSETVNLFSIWQDCLARGTANLKAYVYTEQYSKETTRAYVYSECVIFSMCNILPTAIKDEGKRVPVFLAEHHAMKAYWRSGSIAPFILWHRH